ncbi:hypothetical protein CEXT_52761 [Caerostris extrusa]|uniref:Secreted protein n=1 Tax=Caerostris extrusa TaxID=172846 RepID=A0AAV4WV42_CAEEX|nr:hypothetical protein CEXT_52761 [Caerostris extrusa]
MVWRLASSSSFLMLLDVQLANALAFGNRFGILISMNLQIFYMKRSMLRHNPPRSHQFDYTSIRSCG